MCRKMHGWKMDINRKKHMQDHLDKRVLMLASVASMIDQFNMPNIRLLLEMGYEVHVACNFLKGNTSDKRQICRLRKRLSVNHVVMHQWDCPRSVYAVGKCCRAYRQLCGLLDREGFAWLHCHSPAGGVLARLAAHRRGVPVVYTAHGFHFYRGAPLRNWLFYYPIEKLLSRWTDVLVTVNQEDYRLAQKKMKAKKVFWIPGIGIDTAKFSGCMQQADRTAFYKKYHIPQDAVILLSVGELSKRKNHQAVIRAAAGFRRSDVYYIICGQGPLGKKLARLAKKHSISDRVRMVGFQQDPAVFYQNADIFVFPSLQEGMPAALMEAMAAGMPCIVSDIRGNRELICKGRAVFNPKNPAGLRKALEMMLENCQQWNRYGMRNKQKICAYSQPVVQVKMKKIYQWMDGNVFAAVRKTEHGSR